MKGSITDVEWPRGGCYRGVRELRSHQSAGNAGIKVQDFCNAVKKCGRGKALPAHVEQRSTHTELWVVPSSQPCLYQPTPPYYSDSMRKLRFPFEVFVSRPAQDAKVTADSTPSLPHRFPKVQELSQE